MKTNFLLKPLLVLSAAALLLAACQTGASPISLPTQDAQVLPEPPAAAPSPTLAMPQATLSISPTEAAVTPEPSAIILAVEPTALMTPTVPDYPAEHFITPIHGHSQTYDLGCEASAAVDWAGYFGVPIYEYTFQVSLPHSDNPDYGFVGDVNSVWGQIPPYAYGVYAEPVAETLRSFGLPATALKSMTLEQVKQKIAEDKPVIAWVIGNMEYSEPLIYTDSQGRESLVAPYEHVVILTGYTENSLRYMNNGKFFDVPVDVFLTSWSVLGNMAVVHD